MRKLILLMALVSGSTIALAQQLHFTSQYMQHNPMYNPGAAGIAQKDLIGLSYRNMWSSFPGNPRTYMIYGDFDWEKMNAGISTYIYRDETGPTSRTGLQLAYSYHVKMSNPNHRLGLGLELRALQFAIDKNKISGSLGNDPVLAGAENKLGIDAGAGVYFTTGKLAVGVAASQLIQSKLQLADVPDARTGGKLYRHYNATASYRLHTGADIYLIPNAMVRVIENSPSEFEFGMQLDYQDKVWWGINWRIEQAWSLQAGFKIKKKIGLSYSYDYYQAPISIFTNGSGAHELGLRFELGKTQ
ncbi:MAG TPA: PorP/SprF family type IX secretion system membrane protein [Ferruginibacter sp.]|nr:PorP/SprF family type IX secretion system membrane protein [Ferruginibacter sp.]HRO06410.1 PorP/SprF family type IX secretion system membrane protein [Ferruginibacter sp.]HRO96502.1 PorP/SprF family type IX secretion system membrane protein [Ferruginibacter sp.]HRP50115.1 PorP/SprF family type IX secretion system membrane protein [Ferruginibacter sp.]